MRSQVDLSWEQLLAEVLLISVTAMLSGAESWNDIAWEGESEPDWLNTFLTLSPGIPLHNTFNQVSAALDVSRVLKESPVLGRDWALCFREGAGCCDSGIS